MYIKIIAMDLKVGDVFYGKRITWLEKRYTKNTVTMTFSDGEKFAISGDVEVNVERLDDDKQEGKK